MFLSNFHFDTTKVHIELAGARAFNALNQEALDTRAYHDWKGNFDLHQLERLIEAHGARNVAAVVATVTCNTTGGQPVSMENLRGAAQLARQAGIPVVIDCTRFAENAWFVKQREPGFRDRSPKSIAQQMFSLADGCIVSA